MAYWGPTGDKLAVGSVIFFIYICINHAVVDIYTYLSPIGLCVWTWPPPAAGPYLEGHGPFLKYSLDVGFHFPSMLCFLTAMRPTYSPAISPSLTRRTVSFQPWARTSPPSPMILPVGCLTTAVRKETHVDMSVCVYLTDTHIKPYSARWSPSCNYC